MRTSLKKNIKNGINLSVSLKKTVSGWSGTPMVIVLNTEGELSKIDELPEWAVSEFKDPISEYKEKWKDQNDDLSDGIMNRLRDLGYPSFNDTLDPLTALLCSWINIHIRLLFLCVFFCLRYILAELVRYEFWNIV